MGCGTGKLKNKEELLEYVKKEKSRIGIDIKEKEEKESNELMNKMKKEMSGPGDSNLAGMKSLAEYKESLEKNIKLQEYYSFFEEIIKCLNEFKEGGNTLLNSIEESIQEYIKQYEIILKEKNKSFEILVQDIKKKFNEAAEINKANNNVNVNQETQKPKPMENPEKKEILA